MTSSSGSGSGSGKRSSSPPLPTSPPPKSAFEPSSTMESTSGSGYGKRSSSPPLPMSPPLPTSPPPKSTLRDPLSSPEEPPLPRGNYLEERSEKRRRIEVAQNQSLLHGFELQPHAAKILESNDLSSLQDAIKDYIKSKKPLSKTIFDSLALHYPNALSLKLANLLQLHPPLPIRTETVAFLHHIFSDNSKLNSSILLELKNPLLHSVKAESENSLLPPLCETIGLVAARLLDYYPLGSWEEFLQYICTCVSSEDESNHTKGLMLLAEMPVTVYENRKFWLDQGNYDALLESVLNLNLADLPDEKLQALTFDASVTLIGMSRPLGRIGVCDILLPILLQFIDRHGEEEVVVNKLVVLSKVRRLAELISPDMGEILEGKEGSIFWCMIRLAEVKGVSEELKISAVIVLTRLDEANMDVMQSFLEDLSPQEVKRVLAVALDMMSCVVDDPLWYEVDNKDCQEAGMTDSYSRGKFLLNWLSFEGDEGVVVPTLIQMIVMKYLPHSDWRVRHAAMLAIGTIAAGQFQGEMIQDFVKVVSLVLRSLNDPNHRVLWATMHAIKCLSGHRELLTHVQYHMTLLNRIVPIVNFSLCARVQSYAVIAIRFLVTKCGLEEMSPVAEEIVTLLLILLQHEKRKIQDEALETLKSIALLIPVTFRQHYYDTTMKALKDILLADYNTPSPKVLFRAKCLECMSNLVRKVEQDKFKGEEAVEVMGSLISLEGKLSNTDYITKSVILKALDQFCQCPKVDIDIFLHKMMPMLFGFAELDIDLTADMPTNDSLGGAKHLVESVRVRACNILSYCAVRSSQKFSPYIGKVSRIFVRWVGCSSFETRKASILALPNLLLSIKVGVQNEQTQRSLTAIIVRSMVERLQKETDSDLSTRMLKIFPRCLQISGSFFTSQLIEIIADEINRIIVKVIEIELEKAKEAWTSEAGCEYLPNEEIIQDANNLIETTIETFSAQFLPYVDALMSKVAIFWVHGIPDRVTAYIISIFNIIVPRFPEKLPKYHNKYFVTACDALREDRPYCQLDATRAIGICAEFGEHGFKPNVAVAITRLHDLMTKRLSVSGQSEGVSLLYDVAVAALGKILEFHSDSIDDDDRKEVVRNWLNFLPLKGDFNEARYAHGLLSTMLRRSDKHLFGRNNENLPKIISVVKEILSRPDRLATEEALNQMIDFIDQHGGME